jgi:hypothetical protein
MSIPAPGRTPKEESADQKSLQKDAQQDQAGQHQVEILRPAPSHRRAFRSYLHVCSFLSVKLYRKTMVIKENDVLEAVPGLLSHHRFIASSTSVTTV